MKKMLCRDCQHYTSNGYNEIQTNVNNQSDKSSFIMAINKLQNKIKSLENQAQNMSDVSDVITKATLNESNSPKPNTEVIQKNLEKGLANEALKMAEEKCENLETQLLTLRRLFLDRLVKKSKRKDTTLIDKVLNKMNSIQASFHEYDDNKHTVQSLEKKYESKFDTNDNNYNSDINDDADNYCDDDDGMAVPSQYYYSHNYDKFHKTNTNKSLNIHTTPIITLKPMSYKEKNTTKSSIPFVAGGSTNYSYNRSLANNKLLTNNKLFNSTRLNTNISSGSASCNRKCTASPENYGYFDLCVEFEQLLDKKLNLLNQINSTHLSRDIRQKCKSQLLELSQLLDRKKRQIESIKLMLSNNKLNKECNSNINK